jgi:hypothetical protein
MARTSYVRCDDDDVCFVLDQHAKLDFNRAGTLKQEFEDTKGVSRIRKSKKNITKRKSTKGQTKHTHKKEKGLSTFRGHMG